MLAGRYRHDVLEIRTDKVVSLQCIAHTLVDPMSIELYCEHTGRRTFVDGRQLVLGRRSDEDVLTKRTLKTALSLTYGASVDTSCGGAP